MEKNIVIAMPANNSINENSSLIVKKRATSATIVSALLAVAGLFLCFTSTSFKDSQSILYSASLVVGCGLFFVGGIKLVFGCKESVFKLTGSPIKEYSLFYSPAELNKLIYSVDSKHFDDLLTLKRTTNQGIRLDIKLSKDLKFAEVQPYEYIPYSYQPASAPYIFEGDEAKKLAFVLQKAVA